MSRAKKSMKSRSNGGRWQDAKLIYKWLIGIASSVVLLGGAAVAWGNLGARRVVPAFIGYVDDSITERVTPIITAQTKFESFIQSSQANQVQSQLDNAQAELTKWQAELPRTANPQTRTLIQNRIDTLQKQIPQLMDDIRVLRGSHGK